MIATSYVSFGSSKKQECVQREQLFTFLATCSAVYLLAGIGRFKTWEVMWIKCYWWCQQSLCLEAVRDLCWRWIKGCGGLPLISASCLTFAVSSVQFSYAHVWLKIKHSSPHLVLPDFYMFCVAVNTTSVFFFFLLLANISTQNCGYHQSHQICFMMCYKRIIIRFAPVASIHSVCSVFKVDHFNIAL